jgi:hypothetical protein
MAYEFERDEWRTAVRALTEVDRHINMTDTSRARGLVGDRDDARYDMPCGADDDE